MGPTLEPPPLVRLLVETIESSLDPDRPIELPGDWRLERLTDRSTSANLMPLVSGLLRTGRLALPGPLAEQVHRIAAARISLVMLLEELLGRVADGLADDGIDFLLLKGPALAAWAYGPAQAAWRAFTDLDLLIRREDFERTAAALARLGMRTRRRLPLRRRLRFYNAVEFLDPELTHRMVDVHWNDASAAWASRSILTGPGVWSDSRTIQSAGRTVRTLDPARTLVHLCVHWGYHHQFTSMPPLLDLLVVLGGEGADRVEPADARRLARDARCARVLSLAMLMISALTGREMADWIDPDVLPPRRWRSAIERLEANLHWTSLGRRRRIKAMCMEGVWPRVRAGVNAVLARLAR